MMNEVLILFRIKSTAVISWQNQCVKRFNSTLEGYFVNSFFAFIFRILLMKNTAVLCHFLESDLISQTVEKNAREKFLNIFRKNQVH